MCRAKLNASRIATSHAPYFQRYDGPHNIAAERRAPQRTAQHRTRLPSTAPDNPTPLRGLSPLARPISAEAKVAPAACQRRGLLFRRSRKIRSRPAISATTCAGPEGQAPGACQRAEAAQRELANPTHKPPNPPQKPANQPTPPIKPPPDAPPPDAAPRHSYYPAPPYTRSSDPRSGSACHPDCPRHRSANPQSA